MKLMTPELAIRDHFAGLALKVILATGKRELTFHQAADYAYRQADAMMEVRERYATAPKYSMPDDVSESVLGT